MPEKRFWGKKRGAAAVVLMVAAFIALLVLARLRAGYPLLAPSGYNTYTLQALAWRDGRTFLPEDVPHLELAVYEGRYYVSFPPVPSLFIYPLTFLFGDAVPDGLLVTLYSLAALLILYAALRRGGFSEFMAAFWAFTLVFSSSLMPLAFSGAVWHQAQMLGFLLILASVNLMMRDHPLPGLLCFALAVGCRPFNALYGPLLILMNVYDNKRVGVSLSAIFRRMLPGILAGLAVAAAYGWYNLIRFGNPLEFGHNHLPEFSFQGGIQFSLSHVLQNIKSHVFSLPFERVGGQWQWKQFGFSLFIANPVLLLLVAWMNGDALRKRFQVKQAFILPFFLLHLFLLLTHRTFGGYQYGARYAADLIPYALLYLLTRDKKPALISKAIMALGAGLAFAGSLSFFFG